MLNVESKDSINVTVADRDSVFSLILFSIEAIHVNHVSTYNLIEVFFINAEDFFASNLSATVFRKPPFVAIGQGATNRSFGFGDPFITNSVSKLSDILVIFNQFNNLFQPLHFNCPWFAALFSRVPHCVHKLTKYISRLLPYPVTNVLVR